MIKCLALTAVPLVPKAAYRPQTNGKVERFHRTMADGWAYARCYQSEQERRDALKTWLHHYNQHRPHTACGNQPPFSRLTNVPDRYSYHRCPCMIARLIRPVNSCRIRRAEAPLRLLNSFETAPFGG